VEVDGDFANFRAAYDELTDEVERASGLIHSDDSQIDRSSSSSRHESRNYRKSNPGGPPST
jgi:hypothetical protein